jgi:hypothetical protein
MRAFGWGGGCSCGCGMQHADVVSTQTCLPGCGAKWMKDGERGREQRALFESFANFSVARSPQLLLPIVACLQQALRQRDADLSFFSRCFQAPEHDSSSPFICSERFETSRCWARTESTSRATCITYAMVRSHKRKRDIVADELAYALPCLRVVDPRWLVPA